MYSGKPCSTQAYTTFRVIADTLNGTYNFKFFNAISYIQQYLTHSFP